jgi:hypothetical protein
MNGAEYAKRIEQRLAQFVPTPVTLMCKTMLQRLLPVIAVSPGTPHQIAAKIEERFTSEEAVSLRDSMPQYRAQLKEAVNLLVIVLHDCAIEKP